MGRTKIAVSLISLVLTVLTLRPAARGQSADVPIMDEFTANTVGRNRLKLGLLAFDYGILERLSIGTDPPAWAARAVVSVFVPNLHVKYMLLDDKRLRLSAQLGVYYVDLTAVESASGGLVSVPLTLWASLPLSSKWSVHLEGVYNVLKGFGAGSADDANLDGAVANESLQLGAMLEYRVRPRLALTLRGRLQAWMSPLIIEGEKQFDPYTRADLRVEVNPKREHPLAVVASATYFWNHVHLKLGVGYGSYFLPGANIYLPYQGVIPEASLAFLF